VRWKGFSEHLQTPEDLLGKMRLDFERMKADPASPYPAFDFFVAAEHIVDWRWPDPGDADKRSAVRTSDPGRTVSHLANGAKHFEARAARHTSVADVRTVEDFGTAALGSAVLGEMRLGSSGETRLVVQMTDGRRVTSLELAGLVLAYWETELGPTGIHRTTP
jgi:hypothetical protein